MKRIVITTDDDELAKIGVLMKHYGKKSPQTLIHFLIDLAFVKLREEKKND